ncbi:hypothetical protein HX837_06795, partial [Marine Group I thaumarchaeote]|nr:hypothetical protein [Marine Group I thaumarchaeote]
MSKVRDLVTSTEKLVSSTRRTGRSSFAGFRRADEKEKRLVKEEKHRIEVEKIAREATIFNEKVAEKAARIKAIEDEEKRIIEEQNRIIRTDFVKNKMSNAFGTKTKIDSEPTRQSVVDNILPKAFVPEQTNSEPFKEEPLLNKELADFKKKANEHLRKMGFTAGGGGIGYIADAGDVDAGTARVDGKFLLYQSSSGKWVGASSTGYDGDIADLDIDGELDIGTAIVDADLFIIGTGAGGTNRKVTASRIKTYVEDAAGEVPLANLDIDGGQDIGAAIADDDLFIIDDGAGGTNRKTSALRIATYVGASSTGYTFSLANLDIDGGQDIDDAIVDDDLFIIDDGASGTNRKTTALRLKTYIGAFATSTAADDLTTGDAAVLLTTTFGNITIDATANNTDIIFKGTDDSSDITMLTLDGSEAGAASFNSTVTATGFTIGSATIAESELEMIDGITAGTVAALKAVVVDSNKDVASFRNITLTGELDAATLDISGNADIDGTLEADAYTVDGTALNEYIADTIGAMVGSNTETGIAVTYQDGDNTLDFVIGTLNQDTTGLAATATALATARTIGGVSFDGSANINLPGVNAAGNQSTSGLAATATALATARTIGMTGDVVWTSASFDGSGNVTGSATIQANSIDSAQYVDGSIDLVHMSANSIDSNQYVDGSIDLAHMSANSVDSDQYVDASIDTAHLADDAVTTAKLANSINTDIATGVTAGTVASAALPKAGGALTGAITTNSTFDGVDISTRDAILTSTTTTAGAALPKAGGTITGNIVMSGSETVDGRDLSADGTKLDGIETSATADQTDAEIRTGVEAASDSNVFTDADHTKLNAVEASADVTDTTNVVAALTAGTNIAIAGNGTISSTDTNTTYSAGTGITLTGTTFAAGPIALTTVQVAANQSAQLALTTQEGDVVVRSDEKKSYMRNSGSAGSMADFTELQTPTDSVLSVNGQTGAVTAAHIAAAVEAASDSNTFTDDDHTKLNAIEASATADQTNAEIVAAVEAGSDSNTFTDADHSKLNAIEASATADQTASEIRTLVGSATDSNVYTDALNTKLAAIEASADVTDATNVNAAGAVMESDATTAAMAMVVDEDNMVSNSATKLATQQSIKAYADTGDSSTLSSAQSYADTAEADAVTTAAAAAESKDVARMVTSDAYADASESAAKSFATAADTTLQGTLQGNIDVENARIDAILSASSADKDTFAEIVTFINAVDTTNDTALGAEIVLRASGDTAAIASAESKDVARMVTSDAYADASETAAITTAAATAESKDVARMVTSDAYADASEAAAISTASSDATTKANAAQTAAIADSDAANVAHMGQSSLDGTSGNTVTDRIATAKAGAISTASSDATTKANSAETDAIASAESKDGVRATAANTYADAAVAVLTSGASSAFDTLVEIKTLMDSGDATLTASISALNHDTLSGFVTNEHIDWTGDQGGTNIHTGNYTNTTYSVGDGGLTQINFTTADNSKLDGIEASATADQTNAEIRAGVEAASDSNTFTDADHSKLNAIEASADVTDATNVAAAGAVMESDATTAAMSMVVDEDNMASNSATKLATQQSIKAYADASEAAAISTAASTAESKDATRASAANTYADAAEADAISTAASTAESKDAVRASAANTYADAAEADAITTAAATAESKDVARMVTSDAYADATEAAAISTASSDATTKANAAQAAAIASAESKDSTRASAANAYADAAVAVLTAGASTSLDTLLEIANVMATDTELSNAIAALNHDSLSGFVANEHIDWTGDQGGTNIHAGNYTNTTYSVGDGGLTQINFTSADNTKLDAIESSAKDDQTASEIKTLLEDGINSVHYVDGSIDTVHLAADVITGAKLADNAVNSEHYTDGSIDVDHMSANSVDSNQYVDGSIDTVHIADDQVTLAKMAGLARGKIIYGDASGNPTALAIGGNGT